LNCTELNFALNCGSTVPFQREGPPPLTHFLIISRCYLCIVPPNYSILYVLQYADEWGFITGSVVDVHYKNNKKKFDYTVRYCLEHNKKEKKKARKRKDRDGSDSSDDSDSDSDSDDDRPEELLTESEVEIGVKLYRVKAGTRLSLWRDDGSDGGGSGGAYYDAVVTKVSQRKSRKAKCFGVRYDSGGERVWVDLTQYPFRTFRILQDADTAAASTAGATAGATTTATTLTPTNSCITGDKNTTRAAAGDGGNRGGNGDGGGGGGASSEGKSKTASTKTNSERKDSAGNSNSRKRQRTTTGGDDDDDDDDGGVDQSFLGRAPPSPSRTKKNRKKKVKNTKKKQSKKRRKSAKDDDGMNVLESVMVGSRVSFYWSEDDATYEATVIRVRDDGRSYYLEFDDGVRDWMDLTGLKCRVVDGDQSNNNNNDGGNGIGNANPSDHVGFDGDDGREDESIPFEDDDDDDEMEEEEENDQGDRIDRNELSGEGKAATSKRQVSKFSLSSPVRKKTIIKKKIQNKKQESATTSKSRNDRNVDGIPNDIHCSDQVEFDDDDDDDDWNNDTGAAGAFGGSTAEVRANNDDIDDDNDDIDDNNDDNDDRSGDDSSTMLSEYEQPEPSPDPCTVLIGSKIGVYWPKDKTYYKARVSDFRRRKNGGNGGGEFFLEYFDGDTEWLDLRRHSFRFLPRSVKRDRRGTPVEQIDPKTGKVVHTFQSIRSVLMEFELHRRDLERILFGLDDGDSDSDQEDDQEKGKERNEEELVGFYWRLATEPLIAEAEEHAGNGSKGVVIDEAKQRQMLSRVLVGTRIGVWWKDDRRYYNAVVKRHETHRTRKPYRILYDDGESEWIDLSKERFRILGDDQDQGDSDNGDGDDGGDSIEESSVRTGEGADNVKVGNRVSIYWDGEREWFDGTVTEYRPKSRTNKKFFVEYDDEDEEWLDLSKEKFRVLPDGHGDDGNKNSNSNKKKANSAPKTHKSTKGTTETTKSATKRRRRRSELFDTDEEEEEEEGDDDVDANSNPVKKRQKPQKAAAAAAAASETASKTKKQQQKNGHHHGKAVEQVDPKTDKVVRTFTSIRRVMNTFGLSRTEIEKGLRINDKPIVAGFYWRLPSDGGPSVSTHGTRKPVLQCDLETGEVLYEYASAADASRSTGISGGSISGVCDGRHRQAGGYFWKFSESFAMPRGLNGTVKVVQVTSVGTDATGTPDRREFLSPDDAAIWSGRDASTVRRWCREEKEADGYKWKYGVRKALSPEENVNRRLRIKLKSQNNRWEEGVVQRYLPQKGKYSIRLDNGHVEKVALDRVKHLFRDDEGNEPVQKLCLESGKVLKWYPSVGDAAKDTKTDSDRIMQVLQNGLPSAKGCFWRYADSNALPPKKKDELKNEREKKKKKKSSGRRGNSIVQLDIRSKKVLAKFPSAVAAARELGINRNQIREICLENPKRGGISPCGTYCLRYEDIAVAVEMTNA